VEPVTYREIEPKKEKRSEGGKTVLMEVGAKEEIYTEEHDKLLGTCNTPWTLFVDGYGKDGKRIYDQVRGQTCHQCRYVSTRITIF
jgi:cell division cycle-associated protein 7